MRQVTCCECGSVTAESPFYRMNGKTYCEPCVWEAAKKAKESGQPSEYEALQEHSTCGCCSAYIDRTADHPIADKVPLCPTCASQGSRPNWLKTVLAFFFVPGPIIALLTFPGVVVHEASHLFFCRLFRLQIYDVCFLRYGNPAGYVIHESREDFTALFFVNMGPFLVNTSLCVALCAAAYVPIWKLRANDPLAYFLYWLGLSIGMHAIPSPADLSNLWEIAAAKAKRGNVLAIGSMPLVAFLYILNLGRVVWADLVYGVVVGVLGPMELFRVLARK